MKKYPSGISGRRALLAAGLRYAALGALGAVGGSALVKRRRLLREGKCINNGFCPDCTVFENCGLPQALLAKKTLAGAGNGRK